MTQNFENVVFQADRFRFIVLLYISWITASILIAFLYLLYLVKEAFTEYTGRFNSVRNILNGSFDIRLAFRLAYGFDERDTLESLCSHYSHLVTGTLWFLRISRPKSAVISFDSISLIIWCKNIIFTSNQWISNIYVFSRRSGATSNQYSWNPHIHSGSGCWYAAFYRQNYFYQ